MQHALLVYSLFLSAVSTVQASIPHLGGHAWFYNGGYLVQDQVSGGWSESINATETFYFKETARNLDYVELLDPNRKMSVRLYRDSRLINPANQTQYSFLKNGHYDDRRMFYYTANAGKAGYFLLVGGGMYRHFFRDGVQTTSNCLREIRRTDDAVQVLDPRLNIVFAIHDSEVFEKIGSGGWFKNQTGSWR